MIELTELTLEERAVFGICPVCNAKHGEQCAGDGPHIARLVNAPAAIVELSDARAG